MTSEIIRLRAENEELNKNLEMAGIATDRLEIELKKLRIEFPKLMAVVNAAKVIAELDWKFCEDRNLMRQAWDNLQFATAELESPCSTE